jgi:4-hydroxybenzoate polyprenyltransferase
LERWPRSTAIFVGSTALLFLQRDLFRTFGVLGLFGRLAGSFLLTWFVSTANYIVNEIADAPFDIHHPTKRNRPLARGEIRRGPLVAIGVFLAGSSLAAGKLLYSSPFFLSLVALLAAGFIYNLKPIRTKDIPFLDAISESMNNPIRFLIGWYAFSPAALPPWSLLVCWWAFGNFLMVAKRLSEFRFLKERAAEYRASHKNYSKSSLLFGMAASALVFFASYIRFALVFKLQLFLYFSPFLAFYFFLFFWKTLAEKEVMEEPEKLLGRTRFAVYTAFLFLLYAAAFFLDKIGQ